jgi:antitoxin MazE
LRYVSPLITFDTWAGDQVQASMTVDGGIGIRAAKWDRNAFAQELESMREAMPMTDSVIEELRQGVRY